MAKMNVHCPHCQSIKVVMFGVTAQNKQRYRCQNQYCSVTTFILHYTYQGYLPDVKHKIIEMALNGSGIRDTGRVLNISPKTVIAEIKKSFATRKSKSKIIKTNQSRKSESTANLHKCSRSR